MSREVKRVALDFDWDLGEPWVGYQNPYEKFVVGCKQCGGDGLNPHTRELTRTCHYDAYLPPSFYRNRDAAEHHRMLNEAMDKAWGYSLAEDDIQYLRKNLPRALEPFGERFKTAQDKKTGRWFSTMTLVEGGRVVTAADVNARTRACGPFGSVHDLSYYVVIYRAKKAGLDHTPCSKCKGRFSVYLSPEAERRSKRWKPIQPPLGEGWQLWEGVSSGSPVTPVFATAEELIQHLVNEGECTGDRYSEKGARNLVLGAGWMPSSASYGTGLKSGSDLAEVV